MYCALCDAYTDFVQLRKLSDCEHCFDLVCVLLSLPLQQSMSEESFYLLARGTLY